MPERVQRKRSAGWTMPEGARYVGRPTRWGNPWRKVLVAPEDLPYETTEPLRGPVFRVENTVTGAVDGHYYEADADFWVIANFWDHLRDNRDLVEAVRAELAGADLACWCPEGHACHADVLLEVAAGRNVRR